MREVKNIVYCESPIEPILVTDVKPLADRMMLIRFNNGERRLFDSTVLKENAFAALADEDIFASPVIEYGVITWDEGRIDVAPEFVYANSYEYNERDILIA